MADGLVFKLLCGRMKAGMRAEGLKYADRVHGFFMTGRMSEEYVLHALDHLGEGTFELYCHPAIHEESMELSSHERQCLKEFRILVSERVKARLTRLGIEPTTYGEIRSTK